MSDCEKVLLQSKAEIRDLRELLEIGKSLNSNLKYSILLDSLLLTCMGRAMVTKAGLFIRHDFDSRNLTLYRNYEGFNLDRDTHYSIDENSELVNSLKKAVTCLTMPELLADIKEIADIKPFTILEPSLIIPIVMKKDLQGIIVLGERITDASFDQNEKEFLRNVADLGAIAIHNTFLLEVSATDMMTRLKLKHILFQNLNDIFSSGNGESLVLLMIDIDKFKALNDTYGHSFGDIVIKKIASIVLSTIRLEDLGARYGGEEFTVLLRAIPQVKALEKAEKIRSMVENTVFYCDETPVRSSISIGFAEYNPQTDIVPQDLIKRADRALYQAKESGRNKVVRA